MTVLVLWPLVVRHRFVISSRTIYIYALFLLLFLFRWCRSDLITRMSTFVGTGRLLSRRMPAFHPYDRLVVCVMSSYPPLFRTGCVCLTTVHVRAGAHLPTATSMRRRHLLMLSRKLGVRIRSGCGWIARRRIFVDAHFVRADMHLVLVDG